MAAAARKDSAIVPSPFRDCLCLRLRKGARQTTRIYDECLAPSGLRITQFGLLAHLAESEKPLAVAELAEALDLDPTTLNRNLKPLEQRKLLQVRSGASDRRIREIMLTAAGRSLLTRAAPYWRAAHDRVRAALGEDNADRLGDMLDQSLDIFGKI
jgi:DNA-binding MarR family transcriptional regulator